ncbi:MAG TPA: hypothetical protein VGH45_02425 [Solirubrobacteraceae bacterium]|jgi:hypothetical protein
MQLDHDEYLLLSRGGRVPYSRSQGPPRDPPAERRPVVGSRRVKRHRSLLNSLLVAVSMTRSAVISVQEGRRDR